MPSSATSMELEIITVTIKLEKDKYHDINFMYNVKNDTNESIYKTEIDSQTQKINFQLPKEKRWGRNKSL